MKPIENAKEILLQTAKNVIRMQGLADFNIRTIAEKAGVSIGTVYNYFPAKSDLVVATMQKLLTDCVSVINKESCADLFEDFKRVYFAILGFYHMVHGDVTNDLSTLVGPKEKYDDDVEEQHMKILRKSIAKTLIRHKTVLDPAAIKKIGLENLTDLILTVFRANLKKSPQNYDVIDYFIHRML